LTLIVHAKNDNIIVLSFSPQVVRLARA